MNKLFPLCLAGLLASASGIVAAQTPDDPWVLRFGAHVVDPKSNNGHLAGMQAKVGDSVRPTISIEYLLDQHWGVEALGAVPFKHRVKLDGAHSATVRQLPPVLGVNYHFLPQATWSPFVGLGINYTHFYDAKAAGGIRGDKLSLGDSWGAAAHAGIDVRLSSRWLVTADVRWIDIDSKVKLNGARIGKANVDPWVYGLSFGYRF